MAKKVKYKELKVKISKSVQEERYAPFVVSVELSADFLKGTTTKDVLNTFVKLEGKLQTTLNDIMDRRYEYYENSE